MRVVPIFSPSRKLDKKKTHEHIPQTISLSSFIFHLLEKYAIAAPASVLTIHLSLIREDDLPASTRRIDGQGLLEALFNIRAPHPLCIIVYRLVCRVAHPLHVLGRALAATPAAGINRGGWALQAEAWSRLGRDLEFPNK